MRINLIAEMRKPEEGRLFHDFVRLRFPNGMNEVDRLIVFANCDNMGFLKKQKDEFYSEFEIWKQNKKK